MRNHSVTLSRVEVAAAIADPVRREILSLLRQGPMPAGAIAARFAISRPAVSRHLRVLRETGLVVDRVQGRERVYRLDTRPLAELDAWLAPFRSAWEGGARRGRLDARLEAGLDALETEVRRTGRERRSTRRKPASAASRGETQERTA
jgi:DNA-binding transcriptional ArsR family regulator